MLNYSMAKGNIQIKCNVEPQISKHTSKCSFRPEKHFQYEITFRKNIYSIFCTNKKIQRKHVYVNILLLKACITIKY